MRVDIVGAGPAGREGMTLGGMQALEEAQLVIGAARVLQELALLSVRLLLPALILEERYVPLQVLSVLPSNLLS